jgi:hypothetical protein
MRRRLGESPVYDDLAGRARERHAAREHLVEDACEVVLIAATVELLAEYLLRTHVRGRAEHVAGARELSASRLNRLRDAEIHDLHPLRVVRSRDHDVVGLQVAMHDPQLVRGVQRVGDLARDRDGALGLELPLACEYRRKRLAVHILHHDVGDPLRGLAEVVDGCDVRVVHPTRARSLAPEATGGVEIVGELAAHDLERAFASHVHVFREIHLAHAAHAEFPQYQVLLGYYLVREITARVSRTKRGAVASAEAHARRILRAALRAHTRVRRRRRGRCLQRFAEERYRGDSGRRSRARRCSRRIAGRIRGSGDAERGEGDHSKCDVRLSGVVGGAPGQPQRDEFVRGSLAREEDRRTRLVARAGMMDGAYHIHLRGGGALYHPEQLRGVEPSGVRRAIHLAPAHRAEVRPRLLRRAARGTGSSGCGHALVESASFHQSQLGRYVCISACAIQEQNQQLAARRLARHQRRKSVAVATHGADQLMRSSHRPTHFSQEALVLGAPPRTPGSRCHLSAATRPGSKM